ncbi:photosystem II 10 kDa polypeptidepsbR1-2 [Klebsormidium nitens]|uniref:Photosystem II 10 kDa polypeptide, chloroplastic n=1 Tax=Klebsormidium nitens TaxID=105231 RepID=A0A1Y1HMK5_KLENI|nr:photosystem II 10 kDa polypeptidepsbR1-2 [Klebsormidium nitens]|eukprot:GAQ79855.1 photosystem II 10 kDa polypeptidepsbR1-2 [Klebsormidium nitens]
MASSSADTSAAPALPPMRTSSSLRANKNSPFSNKSAPAQGAQKLVGYKGSTMPGSAPPRRDGKPGVVYRLKAENGKMNVDEYSPIFTPEKWSPTGDTYAPGLAGIALWAITFTTVIGGAAYLVVNTSALGA